MKRTLIRNLKIKLDVPSLSAPDLSSIETWENEGGLSSSQAPLLKSLSPIRQGAIFEVTAGEIHYEAGQLYYEPEFEILASPY